MINLSSYFEPLSGEYCNYFYYVSVITFFTFVVSLLMFCRDFFLNKKVPLKKMYLVYIYDS